MFYGKIIIFIIGGVFLLPNMGKCQLMQYTQVFNENSDHQLIYDSIEKKKPISKYSIDFIAGRQDAREYYNDNTAFAVTFITSLVIPPAGFITTIAISTSDPKIAKLNVPNEQLLKNEEYLKGYVQKAKRIKAGKAWGGCLTGLTFFGLGYLMLYGVN